MIKPDSETRNPPPKQFPYTIIKPVWETSIKQIPYTVMKPVWETREKEVAYTVMKPVWETGTSRKCPTRC